MFRQKPRDNKITPDRLMLDNWKMAYEILTFNTFFACRVQVTFSKNQKNQAKPNNSKQTNKNICKLAAYF